MIKSKEILSPPLKVYPNKPINHLESHTLPRKLYVPNYRKYEVV